MIYKITKSQVIELKMDILNINTNINNINTNNNKKLLFIY